MEGNRLLGYDASDYDPVDVSGALPAIFTITAG